MSNCPYHLNNDSHTHFQVWESEVKYLFRGAASCLLAERDTLLAIDANKKMGLGWKSSQEGEQMVDSIIRFLLLTV